MLWLVRQVLLLLYVLGFHFAKSYPSSDGPATSGWVNEDGGSTLYDHLDDITEFITSHRRHVTGPARVLFFLTDDGAQHPVDYCAVMDNGPRDGENTREQTNARIVDKAANFVAGRTDHTPCSPGRAAIFTGLRSQEHGNTKVLVREYNQYIRDGMRDDHRYDQEKIFCGPIEKDLAQYSAYKFYNTINTGTATLWSSGTSYTVNTQVKRYCNTWDVLTQYHNGDRVQLTDGHKYQCKVANSTTGSIPTTATSEWDDLGANTADYRYFVAAKTTTAGKRPEAFSNAGLTSFEWYDYGTEAAAAGMKAQTVVRAHDQPFGDTDSTKRKTDWQRGDGSAGVWEASATYSDNAWIVCGERMYQGIGNSNLGNQPAPGGTAKWTDKGKWHDDLQQTGSLHLWLSGTGRVKCYGFEKHQNGIGQIDTGNPPYDTADPTTAIADYWLSGTTYASGAKVAHLGYFYTSLSSGNINHPPDSSPSFWGSKTPAYTTRRCGPGWRRFIVSAEDNQDHYRNYHIDFDELIGGPNPVNNLDGQIGQGRDLQYDFELASLSYDSGTNKVTVKTIDPVPEVATNDVIEASTDYPVNPDSEPFVAANWVEPELNATCVDAHTFTYTPTATPGSQGAPTVSRNGTTTVTYSTGSPQPAQSHVGCMVYGPNIPADTTVVSVITNVSWTLSNTVASGANFTMTIGPNITNGFFFVRKFYEAYWYARKHIEILDDVSLYDNIFVYHGWHNPHWSTVGTGGVRDDENTQCEKRYKNSLYSAVPRSAAYGWGGVAGGIGPDVNVAEAADVTRQDQYVDRHNMFASVDDGTAAIMDAWDAKFGEDTYWVVLADDNGNQYGGHHIGANMQYSGTPGTENDSWAPVGGKVWIWDNSVKVSIIVKGPGFLEGATYTIQAELADICLTLLRIFAGAVPELKNHHAFTKRTGDALQDKLAGLTNPDKHQFCRGKYQQGGGTGPGGEVVDHMKIVDKDGNTFVRLFSNAVVNPGVLESTTPATTWVSGTAYTKGQQVLYSGDYYTCIVNTAFPHTSTPAADTSHWMKQYRQLFLGNGTGDARPNMTEYETVDHTFDNASTQALSDSMATIASQLAVGRWEPYLHRHTGKI